MGKKLFLFSLVVLFLTACGVGSMLSADKNIRKVELGMTKKDVVSVMGKDYRVLGATATNEGAVETIGYDNANDGLYVMTFMDGQLINYELTHPLKQRTPHNRNHNKDIRH